jgi:hypothetical protein
MNFSYLNPDNFKKWMKNQDEFDSAVGPRNLVGLRVETRLGAKRIMGSMTPESGRPQKVAKDFVENGGVILEVIGEEYLVKVKSGRFMISKNHVIF